MRAIGRILLAVLAISCAGANASFHLWKMTDIYSSADGSVQYLEFFVENNGEGFLTNHTLISTSGGTTHSFTFPTDLMGATANTTMLVGTQGFAALGIVTPDYIVPNGFFFRTGGTLTFGEGVDVWIHGALPAPPQALNRLGSTALNSPQNFAGQTGSIASLPPATVVLTGPSSSAEGASVTFTATVTGSSPTGAVQFEDGPSNLGTAVALSGGVATRTSTLSVGTHSILASYSGDSANAGADSNTLTHTVSGAAPPVGGGGSSAKTLGARATVTPGVTLFGGFELATASSVQILVRGNSLGTLGVTQGFLDAPRVRLFNSQGQDLLSDGGVAGFTGCSSANAGGPVVTYYTGTRGQPPHARDGCTAQTLAAGVYTFTVTPSTTGMISLPTAGEALFEVTLGTGGSVTKSLGSRATASPTATLFGGFELAAASTVHILVRGNSLGTLGVTQNYLDSPRVRLFNSVGQDLITDAGVAGFTGCSSTANAGAAVVNYYANVRGQPAHARDACTSQAFAAGVYTFAVSPSTSGTISSPATGEILFEVTLSP